MRDGDELRVTFASRPPAMGCLLGRHSAHLVPYMDACMRLVFLFCWLAKQRHAQGQCTARL